MHTQGKDLLHTFIRHIIIFKTNCSTAKKISNAHTHRVSVRLSYISTVHTTMDKYVEEKSSSNFPI